MACNDAWTLAQHPVHSTRARTRMASVDLGQSGAPLPSTTSQLICGLIGDKPRPSTLWQALNSALPRPTQNWSCFSEDPKECANKFNHYFTTVAYSVPSTPLSTDESSINPTPSSPDADSLSILTIDIDECHSVSTYQQSTPTRVLALMVYLLVF